MSVGSPFTLFRMEDGHGVFSETSLLIYVSRYTVVACKVHSTNKIVFLVTVYHVCSLFENVATVTDFLEQLPSMSGIHSQTTRTARGYQFSQEVCRYVCLFMKRLRVPCEIHVYRSCYSSILNTGDAVRYSSVSSCLNYRKQQAIQQQFNGVLLFRNTQRFSVCYLPVNDHLIFGALYLQ